MARIIMEMDTKTGDRTYRVEDVQGEACTDFTRAIREANEVKEHELTEDAYACQDRPDYVNQG